MRKKMNEILLVFGTRPEAKGYPKSHFGSLRFLKMKNDQARNWQKTSEKRFEFMTKRG